MDIWDNEDVLKKAAFIAVGVSIVLIFSWWGDAYSLIDKVMVFAKAVAAGVGVGAIFFLGIVALRLLIIATRAATKATFDAAGWTLNAVMELFVAMIRMTLAIPLAALQMIVDLPRHLDGKLPWQRKRVVREKAERARADEERKERERAKARSEAGGFSGSIATEKQALELFEMAKPYTLDQLKKRRMELLKKVHPDQGGSNMIARMVNEAFELLKSRL